MKTRKETANKLRWIIGIYCLLMAVILILIFKQLPF